MPNIEIEFDVPVPMRDGTVLSANIYRPVGGGPFPVLVARTPYDKNSTAGEGVLEPRALARAGYIVVYQDTRGRFLSEGEWAPAKHEQQDGYDTVEWAAALPGSNGRVGMFGPSYLGNTQWSAAISGAPHLVAIAPTITWSDPEDGGLFRGGSIEHGLNTTWALMTSVSQIPKAHTDPDDMIKHLMSTMSDFERLAVDGYLQRPFGASPVVAATGQPDLGVSRALADPAALDDKRVSTRHGEIDVPSLNIGGWYDLFAQGTIDNYVGMRAQGKTARLVMGPWEHASLSPTNAGRTGEVSFGLSSLMPGGKTVTELHREWYDHWLKEAPATEAHESGVLIFVMGINQWRAEEDWPLARAVETPLYLASGGELSWQTPNAPEATASFVYDPDDPVPTTGGNIMLSGEYLAGPRDQRAVEARDDVLVFTSEPLANDLEVTGRVRATLFAATDGPSTDWVVRLCEVDAHGTSRNLVDGIQRVQTEPGEVQEVDIDLWSTAVVVRAGHRLRVHVTSSCFPRWDCNLNTGEPIEEAVAGRVARQTVHLDETRPSRILLPVVAD